MIGRQPQVRAELVLPVQHVVCNLNEVITVQLLLSTVYCKEGGQMKVSIV